MLPQDRRDSENLAPGASPTRRSLRIDVGDHLGDEIPLHLFGEMPPRTPSPGGKPRRKKRKEPEEAG
jgi:hypothetical protein